MAEVVEEMPGLTARGNAPLYPWDQWLDGRVWRLVEQVLLSAVLDDAGEVVVPEQVVEGDFSVEIEKMRTYARNAAKRRGHGYDLRSRTDRELIAVARVPGEEPVKVERRVLFIQAIPKMTEAPVSTGVGEVAPGLAEDVAAAQAELDAPLAEGDVAAAQAELDALATQAQQPEPAQPEHSDEPEWEEIPVTEDPEDPYPAVEDPWPAMDRPRLAGEEEDSDEAAQVVG